MSTLAWFEDTEVGSRTITIAPGQVVFEPETAAKHVYLIQRGEVRLYMSGPGGACRLVSIVGPGEWFGSAALAQQETYGMRAVAVSNSTLIEAPLDRMLEVLERHPQELLELNRDLAQRLLHATREACSLVFEDCNQRLINTLVRFSSTAASVPHDDGVVLRITHDQLAQAVGVARETVSLALTQLRQQKLLRTGRNQVVFNPEALRRLGSQEAAAAQDYAKATV